MSDSDYNRYYNNFVECDFCGQLTRGRIYEKKKTEVRCGACSHTILVLDDELLKHDISASKYSVATEI